MNFKTYINSLTNTNLSVVLVIIFFPIIFSVWFFSYIWSKGTNKLVKVFISIVYSIAILFSLISAFPSNGDVAGVNEELESQESIDRIRLVEYEQKIAEEEEQILKEQQAEEERVQEEARIAEEMRIAEEGLRVEEEARALAEQQAQEAEAERQRIAEAERLKAEEIQRQNSQPRSFAPAPPQPAQNNSAQIEKPSQGGYIAGSCKSLNAQGLGNFRPGDPNYKPSRDRDDDKIACEF